MATKCAQTAAPAGAVYGLGLIGALIYFVTTASGIGGILLGILKAVVWPGFLVYGIMDYINL